MRSRFLPVALATAFLTGCTHGVVDSDGLPTAPTVAILDLNVLPLGGATLPAGAMVTIATSGGLRPEGVALGAYARYNDGNAHYVEASWTSSDEGIIAIDGTRFVARSAGTATITATFEGHSDTETFIVEGGIAGRWAGGYVVEQCSANSGSVQEVLCGVPGRTPGSAAVGARLPFTVDITESDGELTGVASFGAIRGTLMGRNRGSGFFFLQGLIENAGGAIIITHWDSHVVRDSLDGQIAYQIKIGDLPGFGTVSGKFVDVTRQ